MIEIKGYNYMTQISMGEYYHLIKHHDVEREDYGDINLSLIYSNGNSLTISQNNTTFQIDMDNFLENLLKKHGQKSKEIEQEELTIRDKKNGISIKLELEEISKQFYENNQTIGFNGFLFFGRV
jgi:hypothetical protein